MPKKLKVLVNAVPLTRISTGIGRYLRCLYMELSKQFGSNVDVFFFDGKKIRQDMPSGPTKPMQWGNASTLFWKLPAHCALAVRLAMHAMHERRFRALAHGFDIYHEAGFFPFRSLKGTRTVFTIHDMSIERMPEHHPRDRVLFMRLFLRRRLGLAHRILTVSEFSRQEIQACLGVPGEKITVTHLAPAQSFYPGEESECAHRRSALGLPSQYFLFVGSGDPRKNTAIIPQALEQSGLNIPLASVGWSGWGEQGEENRELKLGYLPDEDLAAVYSGALALIFPSLYEGFGLPLVEAMACGCPVITTTRGSLQEIAGDAAHYVEDPRDVAELARGLSLLAENTAFRTGLRERGLRRAGEYTWASTAQRNLDAFEQAMGQPLGGVCS